MNQFRNELANGLYTPLEDYRTEIVCGYLSIVEVRRSSTVICGRSEAEELLCQTADLATSIVENEDFVRFYARYKMLPDVSVLLSIPDFFANNINHSLTKRLLEYHKRFGVPRVVASVDPLVLSADFPREWEPIYKEVEKEDFGSMEEYVDVQIALLEKQAYPLALTICFLLDFYNLFLNSEDIEEIDFAILRQSVSLEFTYFPEKKVIVFRGTKDGYWNVAYATALTDIIGGKTYGICKKCGKWFIRPRTNAEYCSPQCRNVYNVRKSVLRRKEKEEVE